MRFINAIQSEPYGPRRRIPVTSSPLSLRWRSLANDIIPPSAQGREPRESVAGGGGASPLPVAGEHRIESEPALLQYSAAIRTCRFTSATRGTDRDRRRWPRPGRRERGRGQPPMPIPTPHLLLIACLSQPHAVARPYGCS